MYPRIADAFFKNTSASTSPFLLHPLLLPLRHRYFTSFTSRTPTPKINIISDSKANADMDSILKAVIAMQQMPSEPADAGTITPRRENRREEQKFDNGIHLECFFKDQTRMRTFHELVTGNTLPEVKFANRSVGCVSMTELRPPTFAVDETIKCKDVRSQDPQN